MSYGHIASAMSACDHGWHVEPLQTCMIVRTLKVQRRTAELQMVCTWNLPNSKAQITPDR